MHWEDVLTALLLMDAAEPQDHPGGLLPCGVGCSSVISVERFCMLPPLVLIARTGEPLHSFPPFPAHHPPAGFRAAWRACPSTTALKHLDVDAPLLFKGLHEQDQSGAHCSTRSQPACQCGSQRGYHGCLPPAHPDKCRRLPACLPARPPACGCLPVTLPAAGLWAAKPVQCATGDYLPGDYSGWKRWRDALPSVAHI